MLRHSFLYLIASCFLSLALAQDICSSDKKKGELIYSSPKRCITESPIWIRNYTKEVEEDHGLKKTYCPLSKEEEERGWNVRIVHLDDQAVIDAVFSKAKERISKTNRRWLIGAKNRKKILQFSCPVSQRIKTEEMRSYYEYEDGTKVRDDLWCKNEPLDNCVYSNSDPYYSMAIIYEGQSCLDDYGIEGLRAFALCDYYIGRNAGRQPKGTSFKIIETLYKEKADFRYFDFIIEEDVVLTRKTIEEVTVHHSTHKSGTSSGVGMSATATDVRRKHHTVIVINEENTDESSTGADTYAVGIGAHPAIARHLEELTYIPSNRRFKIPNIEAENKGLCPSLQRLVFGSTEQA